MKRFWFLTCTWPALLALAPLAHAGCGDVSQLQPPFTYATPQSGANADAVVQRAAAATALAKYSGDNAMNNTASIVGMWNVQFISLGNTMHNPPIPDGAQIDFGYGQFHSDGTEILNSGGHSPATENFCLGVWVRTGYFTYEVNHYALSYDLTSQQLTAKIDILEQITLDPSGNEYSGTFTINVFNPTTAVQVDHITGTLTATRVTVDQTTP